MWRRALIVLALGSGAWALVVSMTGGIDTTLAGVRFISRSPTRPAFIAIVATVLYLLVSGPARTRDDLSTLARALTAPRLAMALVTATLAVGLGWNTWSAGGADSYAYVTQADLWLTGNLRVDVPLADDAPWPNALATFTPYGYRTTPDNKAIVPVTAPGLPLMMAGMKAIAGHAAMFWVVPLCGGLLVWSTFAIGRQLGSDAAGACAAWLLATSPTFVAMSKSVMSDVPAAAFWALAMALALSRTFAGSLGAGAAASVAIAIRPNLLPVGVAIGAWTLWRETQSDTPSPARVVAYAAGLIPGCVTVAAVNAWLYGGPFVSGYGSLSNLFALANLPANTRNYLGWLIETQTPIVLLGLVAVVAPVRAVWGPLRVREGPWLLAAVLVAVWGSYLTYAPFDAWWFLRFLLPSWPSLLLATAFVLARLLGQGTRGRVALAGVVVALGLLGVRTTLGLGVFPAGEGERRYATVAELVAARTEPSSVIITGQHVGATRYYAGRLTLQYDALDPEWLDRAVAWLQAQHHPVYFLLEDWESPPFATRFGPYNLLGRLAEMSPVMTYTAYNISGQVSLFDPLQPTALTQRPLPIRRPEPVCPLPAPLFSTTIQ